MLKYKDYTGILTNLDSDAGFMHGEVVGIRDVITFQGSTVKDFTQAFQDSVDDYLAWCDKLGQSPEKPYSGKFTLRVPTELHARIADAAVKKGVSLNTFVTQTLEQATKKI